MTQVWAVLMAKDEADVIGPLLDHLTGEGVDGIVVADNMSTDGTAFEVCRWIDAGGPGVLVQDQDLAYRQSVKMTALAAQAHDLAGTDDLWIVPVDADEVWYDGGGSTLAERLRQTEASAVHAPIWNHWCTSGDGDDPNPFLRIRHRAIEAQEPLGKIAYRWKPDIVIGQGNHVVFHMGFPVPAEFVGVAIRHFPYRSPEHFVAKARNGAAAYAALEAEGIELGDMGAHWRAYGDLLERGGEQAAVDWFHTHFFYDPADLVEDPAPIR